MIKHVLVALASVTLAAQPVSAHKRDHSQHQHHERHRSHSSTGKIILGIIAGAAIAGVARDDRYRYDPYSDSYPPNVYPYNQYYCAVEQHVDIYGRIFYTRKCNY